MQLLRENLAIVIDPNASSSTVNVLQIIDIVDLHVHVRDAVIAGENMNLNVWWQRNKF